MSDTEQSKFEGFERWRPVVDFEEQYEVSVQGRVRRSGRAAQNGNGRGGGARIGRCLKHHLSTKKGGYPTVQLWRDGKPYMRLVHALVAGAFLGPVPDGYEVNHIDGVKSNPAASNLEYTTHSENIEHAYANGLRVSGEDHALAKLTAEQVREIRSLYVPGRRGYGCRKLARRFGVSKATIQDILSGKNWKHLEAQ